MNNNVKSFNLMAVLIPVVIIVLIVTFGFKSINKNSSNGDNKLFGSNSEIKYINENHKKASKSKLAFVKSIGYSGTAGEVITVDYEDLLNERVKIGSYGVDNDKVSVTEYSENGDIDIEIDGVSYYIEVEFYDQDTKEIYKDGNWVITDSYDIVYCFGDPDDRLCLIFRVLDGTLESAKQVLNNAKKIFNVYTLETWGDFINAKDISGKDVSLKDYTFFNDLISDELTNIGLYIKDSSYIERIDGDVELKIPYDENQESDIPTVEYEIEAIDYEDDYPSEDEFESAFTVNGNTVNVIDLSDENDKELYMTYKNEYYSIVSQIPYSEEDESLEAHKNLFINSFQK